MDQGTGFIQTLIHNLYTVSDSTYYHLLLLIFLLLPIYMLIRFSLYIIHYLKEKQNTRQTDIAI